MARGSDNIYPHLLISEGSAPALTSSGSYPGIAAGQQGLYLDSADHKLKRINNGGTITVIEGGGGGGSVVGPAGIALVAPPTFATWYNQGSATSSLTGTTLSITAPLESSENWHILAKALPATPYTITAYVAPTQAPFNYNSTGLVLLNSSTLAFEVFGFVYSGATQLDVGTKSNYTTSTGGVGTVITPFQAMPLFLRIADDGTTRTYSFSQDGINWLKVASEAHAGYVTPDKIGLGVAAINSSYAPSISLISYQEA